MMHVHSHLSAMTHNAYDNAGPSIPGLGKDLAPTAATVKDCAAEDLAAFDQLGPLTRAAMNEGVVRWSSVKTLQLISDVWRQNPKHPLVDRRMADMIREANIGVALKIMDQACKS
jgi:hypothetical protein